MASVEVKELATKLRNDSELRDRFRRDARQTVAEIDVNLDSLELDALGAVDWPNMSDTELMVRLDAAAHRLTKSTV